MNQVDVSRLLEEIRREIEIKRVSGEYPPGLEQQLEQEFSKIIASTNRNQLLANQISLQLVDLKSAIEQLENRNVSSADKRRQIRVFSFARNPRRQDVNRNNYMIAEIQKQIYKVLISYQEFAESLEDADKRLVRELIQHVMDRVAVIDHLAQIYVNLEDRISSLESRLGQ